MTYPKTLGTVTSSTSALTLWTLNDTVVGECTIQISAKDQCDSSVMKEGYLIGEYGTAKNKRTASTCSRL